MKGLSRNNPLRDGLLHLINAINREVKLSEENQVIIVIKLDTEEKIIKFSHWIASQIKYDKFISTEEEIVRAAVQIGKGIR